MAVKNYELSVKSFADLHKVSNFKLIVTEGGAMQSRVLEWAHHSIENQKVYDRSIKPYFTSNNGRKDKIKAIFNTTNTAYMLPYEAFIGSAESSEKFITALWQIWTKILNF